MTIHLFLKAQVLITTWPLLYIANPQANCYQKKLHKTLGVKSKNKKHLILSSISFMQEEKYVKWYKAARLWNQSGLVALPDSPRSNQVFMKLHPEASTKYT